MSENLKLDLENMTPEKAHLLAQLVKRLSFSDVRGCAVDDDEAYRMMDSVVELQKALDHAGYSPA